VDDAEKRAAPYPSDPRVQVELAEAEFDAGNDAATDAAADRVLAADPTNNTALLYKGRVAVRRARAAHATDAATWAAARGWFVKANRADTEAALPLYFYYQSFLGQGVRAPDLAVQGLRKAETLAPEDSGIRWLLARRELADGNATEARGLLVPIAYAPHGGGPKDTARAIIGLIDSGKTVEARAKIEGDKSDQQDAATAPKSQPKS